MNKDSRYRNLRSDSPEQNTTGMEDAAMQLLKDRIRKDGKVKEGNVLKVDSFLNHQMDLGPVLQGDRKRVPPPL